MASSSPPPRSGYSRAFPLGAADSRGDVSQDRTVRCWDLTDGRCEFVFGGNQGIGETLSHRERGWLHKGPLIGCGILGNHLISGAVSGEVFLWNRLIDDKETGGDLLDQFVAHERGIKSDKEALRAQISAKKREKEQAERDVERATADLGGRRVGGG